MQPRSATKFPGAQNFFSDVNATGFTENMWKPGQSKKPSQFVGINGDTYTYPSNLVGSNSIVGFLIVSSLTYQTPLICILLFSIKLNF